MIIVCTTDDNYLRHCAAMLRTFRDHNPEQDISVYIVHGELDPVARAGFVAYLGEFLPSFSMLQVDPTLLEGFPVFGHISIATYFRLLFPAALPHAIRKVLFLDADMVITDSLRPLWNVALGDAPVAAVHDHSQVFHCGRMGIPLEMGYFNAGVLLINLEQWRQTEVMTEGLAFARDNPEKIVNWDQDVLNHLFRGRWLHLPERWNACPHLWGLNKSVDASDEALSASEREARDTPAIIHFAGGGGLVKPWSYHSIHPMRHLYREAIGRTPWASTPLESQPQPTWKQRLKGSLRAVRARVFP